MTRQHSYKVMNRWTGNQGSGTSNYAKYSRDHELGALNKLLRIPGSSDPSFRGDPAKYNPEELLVASISACHMLWYLHFCSTNGIVVHSYVDNAEGLMIENHDGSGQFESVLLKPQIVVTSITMTENAKTLHKKAHQMCFIANSCNFSIECHPKISVVASR